MAGLQTFQINLPSAEVHNALVFLINIEIYRKPKIHLAVESVAFVKSYTLPEGQVSWVHPVNEYEKLK